MFCEAWGFLEIPPDTCRWFGEFYVLCIFLKVGYQYERTTFASSSNFPMQHHYLHLQLSPRNRVPSPRPSLCTTSQWGFNIYDFFTHKTKSWCFQLDFASLIQGILTLLAIIPPPKQVHMICLFVLSTNFKNINCLCCKIRIPPNERPVNTQTWSFQSILPRLIRTPTSTCHPKQTLTNKS